MSTDGTSISVVDSCYERLKEDVLSFVGISDSKESLQKVIDVVYSYCSKWRLRANVIKSAVMVFSKDTVKLMVVGSGASIVFQKYLLIVI